MGNECIHKTAFCSRLSCIAQKLSGLECGEVIDKTGRDRNEKRCMNIHHLELFYYVAKHGGISQAARNISYGIQQPAVSSQIIQLEEFLGTTLFHRRPF